MLAHHMGLGKVRCQLQASGPCPARPSFRQTRNWGSTMRHAVAGAALGTGKPRRQPRSTWPTAQPIPRRSCPCCALQTLQTVALLSSFAVKEPEARFLVLVPKARGPAGWRCWPALRGSL